MSKQEIGRQNWSDWMFTTLHNGKIDKSIIYTDDHKYQRIQMAARYLWHFQASLFVYTSWPTPHTKGIMYSLTALNLPTVWAWDTLCNII